MRSSRAPSRPAPLRPTTANGSRGLGERLDHVENIAVVQAGGLGDLLLTLPALEALRAAYGSAQLTLLTGARNVELLSARTGPWTRIAALPAAISLDSRRGRLTASTPADGTATPADAAPTMREVLERLADIRFDIAVQLTVGSAEADEFVHHLAPRVSIGASDLGVDGFDRSIDLVPLQHATLRALEVVGLVGAPPAALTPKLSVERADRDRARNLLSPFGDDSRPLLTLHPGASDPRHRWPTGWFGEIAARAVGTGWRVAVVGEGDDGRLARDLIGQAVSHGADCRRILDLTGRTDLSGLAGIIDASAVVVGNDSGPLHLAEAIGTPSVGIFWVGGSITSAPLSRANHRVHIGWTTSCPVCGKDATQALWTGDRCGHEPSYVTAVAVGPVWNDVTDLVADFPQQTGRRPDDAFDSNDTGAFDPRDLDDY